jgi:hypothetical protein
MTITQKAILPGFLFGSLLVILVSSLAVNSKLVFASGEMREVTQTQAIGLTSHDVPGTPEVINADDEFINDIPADCNISHGFPNSVLRWCNWIQESAMQEGLNPDLVAAVILHESDGNPSAYSASGATGLMQVMPRDGLAAGFWCANGPCFSERPTMNQLFFPQFNIQYGTQILADLVRRHGSVREGLRAYGPVGVDYQYADMILLTSIQ